jgi:GTP pyrophosphokinase
LAELRVNIEHIVQRDKPQAKKSIDLIILVSNIVQLNNVLDKLNGLPHIISTSRN